MIERNDFYGFTIRTVGTVREQERPPFLVDGVLHSTMTLLYGEAKTGKSTLAAALAVALANGEPDFLGKTVTAGGPVSVGVIAGDFGDDDEYDRQLAKVLPDTAPVRIYDLNRPPERRVWEGLQLEARQRGHKLMIVDNLTAFVDGSLNDDVAVNRFYDQLDGFLRDGVAVLVVAHTSEKSGEHGKSPYPMGSSAIRARARWLWQAQPVRSGMRLAFTGNYGAPHEIIVSRANGVPRFDVLSAADADELTERRAKRSRQRSDERKSKADQVRAFVLAECQGLNGVQTAERLAAKFGGSPKTYGGQLSRAAYGVRLQDGMWKQTGSAV